MYTYTKLLYVEVFAAKTNGGSNSGLCFMGPYDLVQLIEFNGVEPSFKSVDNFVVYKGYHG